MVSRRSRPAATPPLTGERTLFDESPAEQRWLILTLKGKELVRHLIRLKILKPQELYRYNDTFMEEGKHYCNQTYLETITATRTYFAEIFDLMSGGFTVEEATAEHRSRLSAQMREHRGRLGM